MPRKVFLVALGAVPELPGYALTHQSIEFQHNWEMRSWVVDNWTTFLGPFFMEQFYSVEFSELEELRASNSGRRLRTF